MFLHGGCCTSAATCSSSGSSATTSRTPSAASASSLFYLACGLAAALAQVLASPGSPVPMVGASGAIAGGASAPTCSFPAGRVDVVIILIILIQMITLPPLGSCSGSRSRCSGLRRLRVGLRPDQRAAFARLGHAGALRRRSGVHASCVRRCGAAGRPSRAAATAYRRTRRPRSARAPVADPARAAPPGLIEARPPFLASAGLPG